VGEHLTPLPPAQTRHTTAAQVDYLNEVAETNELTNTRILPGTSVVC
jgi:hypothetical protein